MEPGAYVVRDYDDIINIDTTLGSITLVFANIKKTGFLYNSYNVYINDIGNSVSTNPLVLEATGGDSINSNTTLSYTTNGVSLKIAPVSLNEWLAIDSSSAVPGIADKNYVHTQSVANTTWNVIHNLAKRCSVNIVDDNFNDIGGKITWVNNNQVDIEFNKQQTGYVYCN